MTHSHGMKSFSLDEDYILVAAIDFGTTFSGYAFSFKHKPNIMHMNKNWGAVIGCDSYKAPTCVMTNPDGSFCSFGYEAESEHNQLESEKDEIGGPNGYNLYRNFKMLLHNQGVNTRCTVESTSGNTRKALDIFIMVLEYLKEHMMNQIKKAVKAPLSSSDIRWVITVPAIWDDQSKRFMREAAFEAGLISEKYSTKLLIALEPEVASIFCRSSEMNNFTSDEGDSSEDLTFLSGERILIIDAGGGTVDITAHEIQPDGSVNEIYPPCGGPWGAVNVDEQFVLSLKHLLGGDFIDQFKADRPKAWMDIMNIFEKAKKGFKPDGKYCIIVPLPYIFVTDFDEFTDLGIKDVFRNTTERGIRFSSGSIIVNNEKAKRFFSESVEHIVDQVLSLLSDNRLKNLNYVFLVGGFAGCKILQDACQSCIPQKIKLLVPVEAELAVLKGAVLFGHNPWQVCSRIARFTYGLEVNMKFNEGIHNPAKKYINYKGEEQCKDIFDILVTKGEAVKNRHTKTLVRCRTNEEDKVGVRIFKTDKTDVTYVDEPGVTKVAAAVLDNFIGDSVEIKLTFGYTEMLIEAREKDGGDNYPVKITVDF